MVTIALSAFWRGGFVGFFMVFGDFCILIHYVIIFLGLICEVGETGIIFQPKEKEREAE